MIEKKYIYKGMGNVWDGVLLINYLRVIKIKLLFTEKKKMQNKKKTKRFSSIYNCAIIK